MNNDTLTYFEEAGYRVVTPQRLYGRNSELQSGEANVDGGYREVSVEEMFGEVSVKGTGGEYTAVEATLSSSPLFHSVVLVTLIVYLAILMRSWGFIRSIWSEALKTDNDQRMVFEGGELPLQRFKLTASLLGIAVVAMAIVRIAEHGIPATADIYSSALYTLAPLAAIVVVFLFVLWSFIYHKLIGLVIESDTPNALAQIGYTNFVRMVILLYPITAVWLLADGSGSSAYTITLIVCCSVLLLLYLKDTFVFFLGKKISIFYWILYLCTAILLPWNFAARVIGENISL